MTADHLSARADDLHRRLGDVVAAVHVQADRLAEIPRTAQMTASMSYSALV